MYVTCAAPGCSKRVLVEWWPHFKAKVTSLLNGGDFAAFEFCLEHNERMRGVDDGDPTTNPDLEETHKQNEQD